ncbi:serine hydrolase domain-containing protein [Foetidibacter luteolus]|uniref:serine hydrolase domain-containing protein n=1 Tax=Foetidibacter luteolus TaxID=2608880 RepID=UPI00129BC39B|nr:serine hydrolase domain-containing protein [Foetidibacter luteolus]
MLNNKLLPLLLSLLLVSNSFSQTIDKAKLDNYLRLLESSNKLMGNVLVRQHNKNLYSRSVGFSNIKAGTRANGQTMYRIGSITKTITAVLILKAIEEGRLQLSDNIKAYFPSIQHAEQVTVNQLLNHHSGIHNFTGGNYLGWNTQPKNRQDLIDTIAKGGSDFPPGTKASYSNSNYVLLSFILEDIYHSTYGEILKAKITEPLQLTRFQLGDKMIDPQSKSLSYNFTAGWDAAVQTDLSIPLGAGAIVASADDLAKVLEAIFQGRIISAAMLATMEEQTDGMGLGVFQKNILGQNAYMHDGAIDGFNSYYYYFPQDQTLYVLLSNAKNYKLETVNETILSIVFDKPVKLPVFNTYAATAEDMQQYSGTYTSESSPLIIDIWVKNNFLLAQPHGQRIYTMEATAKDEFLHEETNVTLNFVPGKKQMILKQGPQTIVFTKQ